MAGRSGQTPWRRRWLALLTLTALYGFHVDVSAQRSRNYPGVLATYESTATGATATRALSDARFAVAPEESPTYQLPSGAFRAELRGALRARLRTEAQLRVVVEGAARISVNEQVLLETEESATITSPSFELEKGNNPIVIEYRSAEDGSGRFQLEVNLEGAGFRPFTSRELIYTTEDMPGGFAGDLQYTLGRRLFVEHRCAACHTVDGAPPAPTAPSFEGIGSRLTAEWMRAWISDPKSLRESARMPSVAHMFEDGTLDSVVGYLVEQKMDAPPEPVEGGDPVAGYELFQKLHCMACHSEPGFGADPESGLVSLDAVSAKFQPGALRAFLLAPERHYDWIRMPNFGLSADEATHLASYLRAATEAVAPLEAVAEIGAGRIPGGRSALVGCFQCHAEPEDRDSHTMPKAEALVSMDSGCLASEPEDRAPFFGFSDSDRSALVRFLETGLPSLDRHSPMEFASVQLEALNCAKCHGELEGIPSLPQMTGKLREDWTASFLAGEVAEKPRPWLESRMPAFPSRSDALAEGLARTHGFLKDPDAASALSEGDDFKQIGRQLVSANGGFNCVQCHAIGSFGATEVFEAPGINLAWSHERLRPEFFRSWILDPLLLDPMSRMPDFLVGDRSPYPNILGGSASRQVDAIWEYLSDGRATPPPEAPETEDVNPFE